MIESPLPPRSLEKCFRTTCGTSSRDICFKPQWFKEVRAATTEQNVINILVQMVFTTRQAANLK
jgi:hypothetical protein